MRHRDPAPRSEPLIALLFGARQFTRRTPTRLVADVFAALAPTLIGWSPSGADGADRFSRWTAHGRRWRGFGAGGFEYGDRAACAGSNAAADRLGGPAGLAGFFARCQ